MTEPVEWDDEVPEAVRRVALDLVESQDVYEGHGPVEALAGFLDVMPPGTDEDHREWVRGKVAGLPPRRVYALVQSLAEGGESHDERVTDALAAGDVPLRLVGGAFERLDDLAEELEVDGVLEEPTSLLVGRFLPTKQMWDASRASLASKEYERAVASAVNALESAIRIASNNTSRISDGVGKLFTGHRAPLGLALNQLHNYGSAMPNVRHGGAVVSTMTPIEAVAVCRAAAVFVVMVVELDRKGFLPLT